MAMDERYPQKREMSKIPQFWILIARSEAPVPDRCSALQAIECCVSALHSSEPTLTFPPRPRAGLSSDPLQLHPTSHSPPSTPLWSPTWRTGSHLHCPSCSPLPLTTSTQHERYCWRSLASSPGTGLVTRRCDVQSHKSQRHSPGRSVGAVQVLWSQLVVPPRIYQAHAYPLWELGPVFKHQTGEEQHHQATWQGKNIHLWFFSFMLCSLCLTMLFSSRKTACSTDALQLLMSHDCESSRQARWGEIIIPGYVRSYLRHTLFQGSRLTSCMRLGFMDLSLQAVNLLQETLLLLWTLAALPNHALL